MNRAKSKDIVVVGEKWQFGRVPTLLLKAKKPSRAAYIVAVYGVLDWHGNGQYPGRQRVGDMAGCSEATVTEAYKWLCKMGFLKIQRRPNKSSRYFLFPDGSGKSLKSLPESPSSHSNETKA
jgi:hypothetical protein